MSIISIKKCANQKSSFRFAFPGLMLIALTACGGGGGGPPPAPPTISNLALNQTSVSQSSGTTSVPGSFQFTDPAGNLASFTVTVLDSSGKQVSTAITQLQGASGKTSGTVAGTVQFVASTPGVFTIQIYVADAGGAKSNTLTSPFQVIAAASMAAMVTATGPGPGSLTVSNGTLYWLESGEDALKSVAVAGGAAQAVATRMVSPSALAFFGTDVLWSDFRRSGGGTCPGTPPDQVLKRTSAAGATTVVASGAECQSMTNIAVAGSTLYWVSSDTSQQTLNATQLSGGATTAVTTTIFGIRQLVAANGALYWAELDPAGVASAIRSVPATGGAITTILGNFDLGVGTFAVDSTNVYYTTPVAPNVMALLAQPLAGGAPTTLVASMAPPNKLITAGANIAWIDGTQQVWSVPVAGGPPVTLATVTGGGPFDVAFDGSNVVWTDASNVGMPSQSGALRAVPPTGGTVATLYQTSDLPQQLAIDSAGRVNWIESNGQGLARIARLGAGNSVQTVADGISSSPPTFVVAGGAIIVPDLYRLKSFPAAGGVPSTLLVDTWPIGNLATDGSSLVWNDARNGTLRKAPVTGGAVTVLADLTALGAYVSAPGPIHLGSNGNAYWVANVSQGPGLAQANVVTAPIGSPSTTVTAVAPNLPEAADMDVDSTGVYIAEQQANKIIRAPLTSGGALTTVASTAEAPRTLALDGASLYWVDALDISKMPTAGGTILGVLDFDAGAAAASIAIDSSYVYFTEPSTQDIRRTPK